MKRLVASSSGKYKGVKYIIQKHTNGKGLLWILDDIFFEGVKHSGFVSFFKPNPYSLAEQQAMDEIDKYEKLQMEDYLDSEPASSEVVCPSCGEVALFDADSGTCSQCGYFVEGTG